MMIEQDKKKKIGNYHKNDSFVPGITRRRAPTTESMEIVSIDQWVTSYW